MTEAEPPREARHRRSYGPGWIWAVPLAALAIVAWLVLRDWRSSGPEVTVIFPGVANLRTGDTKVKFQSMEVGEVSSAAVEPDLRHMRVQLSLHSDMSGKIGKGTGFWIGGNQISLSHLADITSLISGPYIGIDPKPGRKQAKYIGLSEPPIPSFGAQGTLFTLHADALGSAKRGTPIYYLDQQVGEVQATKMIDARGFDIDAFIDAPYDKLVHDGTRFWNAGAVHLAAGGSGPTLQFQSVPALFEGAIAFETPFDSSEGAVSKPQAHFQLFDSRDTAENAPDARGVAYRVVFQGASGSLGENAPVKLMGSQIGVVRRAELAYDPAKGQISIDATLVLNPSRITLTGGASWTDPRAQMDALMQHLVAEGLQAGLASSPPVIGGQMVSLRIVPGQHGALGPGPIPEIPTSAGSDITGIMATAGDIATKIDQLPLSQIGDEVHDATGKLAELAQSPALRAALQRLDRATADLEQVTHEARSEVPPALAKLRQAVEEAAATLASMDDLLSHNAVSETGSQTSDLPATLYEVSRAARSLRDLSDFLERHPEALLAGRGARQ